MKRPQIGAKYICIKDEYRGFTKGQVYKTSTFDIDDDILFKNDSGAEVFFTWKEKHRLTTMYITDFFKPCKIYLGGE